MKIFLAAMIGIPTLASCILSGLAHARQKVYGLPASALFGDAQKRYDVGLLPLAVLKTGVFSIIGVWAAFLLRLGTTISDAIFMGMAFGALLSLFHSAIVWKMTRSAKMLSAVFGGLIGIIIGEIVGVLGTMIFFELYRTDLFVIFPVTLVLGTLIGAANARKIDSKRFLRKFHGIAAEIISGGVSVGSAGLVLLLNHALRSRQVSDLCFLPHLSILLGWFISITAMALYGLLYPLHRLLFVTISRIFTSFRISNGRQSPRIKLLLIVIIFVLSIVAVFLSSKMLSQVYPLLSTKRVFLTDRANSTIRFADITSDGDYITVGMLPDSSPAVGIEKFDSRGKKLWEQSLTGHFILAASLGNANEIFLVLTAVKDEYTVSIVDATGAIRKAVEIPPTAKRDIETFTTWAARKREPMCMTTRRWFPDNQLIMKAYNNGSSTSGEHEFSRWLKRFGVKLSQKDVYVPKELQPFSDGAYLATGTLAINSQMEWETIFGKEESRQWRNISGTVATSSNMKWVARFDKDDRLEWRKIHKNQCDFVGLLSDGGHLISQRIRQGDVETYWLFRFDAAGEILWRGVLGDSNIDSLQEAEDGSIWILILEKEMFYLRKFDKKGRKIEERSLKKEQIFMPFKFYIKHYRK